ncbi:TetR/AcrR family transcriptional regulator [Pseudoduganella sp. LjRoot289]|uniref:TetR/AcrR family transcriptional regulator n=1 Tax=Pseudoduganella sp. LjRoot289 TaxID=3342314 RepID=UPI003ECCC76F
MSEETPDRRRQKTRTALHGAFLGLLLDQGYDALKIGDVVERANVGRSTFYEHYRTKHDLLRASIGEPFAVLADLVLDQPAAERLPGLLQHFRDNQRVARVLLAWPTRPKLAAALAELIAERLAGMDALRPLLPLEAIARQIADSQLALVETWVLGRPACELAAVDEALRRSTGALLDALARPPDAAPGR